MHFEVPWVYNSIITLEFIMNENDVTTFSNDVNFTISAADKVAELIKEENNSNLNLRVSITGGGCSGFQYGFSFDEQINEDDTVIVQQCSDGFSSVKLLIDSMSYQYLQSAEIDYVQGIQGEQFVIRNPNAKTTCGCGSSFSLDDEDE